MSASQQPTDPMQLLRTLNGSTASGAGDTIGEPHEAPKARPVVRCMSDVEPRRVEYLWPGYIVRHKFNLIAGYGGVGKGQVMANLIARGSRGTAMPTEPRGLRVSHAHSRRRR